MKISFYSSNEEVLKEIGDRIKEARIGKDITQKEMAERTELSQRTIKARYFAAGGTGAAYGVCGSGQEAGESVRKKGRAYRFELEVGG